MSIATDELLVEALLAIEETNTPMTFSEIAKSISKRRGGVQLTDDEIGDLRECLYQNGNMYILWSAKDRTWTITPEGRAYARQISIEPEELVDISETDEALEPKGAPFNPALIKVDVDQMHIYHALKLIREQRLVLQPEFQRNFIWDEVRQSRLIESILLRIALPAFYLDAPREDTYVVIDGLQRLKTLDRFCNEKSLKLTGLEYLREFENHGFSDLPSHMRSRLEETRLTMHIIRPETPLQVKFIIFRRINTGGLVLTNQEIRHALYQGNDGRASRLLKNLAESPEFLDATDRSISPRRMDDRECVLRFLTFVRYPYEQFGRNMSVGEPPNLDGLLNRTMADLNALPFEEHDRLKEVFRDSMCKAHLVFGRHAFRKIYGRNQKRQPISKPLFEVWSTLLRDWPIEILEQRREQLIDGFIEIMHHDFDFIKSISYGTGSVRAVKYRFDRINRMLRETLR